MTSEPKPGQASLTGPVLAAAAVFFLGVLYHWPAKLDHDVSYFLAMAHLVNQGARLYVDLLEFNTPASVELSQLSDWIATALHTPLDLTHKAVLLAVMAGCLAASLAVVSPFLRRPGPGRWCIAIGLAVISVFAAGRGIGWREHLCCITVLPWALSIAMGGANSPAPATTPGSRAFQIVIGAAAGFGLFFKPHFVVFGVALGLIDLLRAKGRPHHLLLSTWVAAAVSVALYAYLALQPGYLAEMLPFYLQTMGALRGDEKWALSDALLLIAIIVLAFLIVQPARGEPWPWLPTSIAVAFCTLALSIFFQQGFGFGYQLMPMKVGIAVAAVFGLAWRLSGNGSAPARLAAIALVAVTCAWFARDAAAPYTTREDLLKQPLLAALRPPHPGDSILAVSTAVDPFNDYLTVLDVTWAGANLVSLPIASLIHQDGRYGIDKPLAPETRERMAAWYLKKSADALRANPPVRVAIETSAKPFFFDNSNFDLLAWMRESPDFDAAWTAAGLVKTGEPVAWQDRTYQMYAPAGSR